MLAVKQNIKNRWRKERKPSKGEILKRNKTRNEEEKRQTTLKALRACSCED
jgi:hypothetical protein